MSKRRAWKGQKVARSSAKAALSKGDLEGGTAIGSTKRK